ncbi:hypothetical protein VPH35_050266 [Triticum aestivum]
MPRAPARRRVADKLPTVRRLHQQRQATTAAKKSLRANLHRATLPTLAMDIGSVPSQDDDAAAATPREATLGRHLARRLAEVGARDVFAVPGDFNLTLLDELESELPSGGGVRLVGCCNELNAAYAADGYARARAGGVGACVVTFTVGALSAINAVAGAFSENLPVVCISGGPNSNDYGSNRILHHTIGLPDFSQELRCFQNVTCYQGFWHCLDFRRKFGRRSESVEIIHCLNLFDLYLLISIFKPNMYSNRFVPEHHPGFIGTYWGISADAYLFAGPVFNDHSSVGYSLLLNKEKAIIVQPDRIVIGNGPAFGCVLMKDFLRALATRLKTNTAACEIHSRIFVPEGEPRPSEPGEPLRVNVFFKHIQKMLSGNSAVIAETGDSWFNCQKLKLPEGCGYECQLQYGSIGWSVGATLGYAQAAKDKRVISLIGDGSFQVTAQEVSTMLRWGQNNIIFLINNGGYTIEVKIDDGPYNVIKNWNYTGVVEAFRNGEGKCYTAKVRTEEELEEAIEASLGPNKGSLCFIEVIVHKDDTSKELLVWGARLFAANNRPPNPQ